MVLLYTWDELIDPVEVRLRLRSRYGNKKLVVGFMKSNF